ncbi:MAG: lipoyl(octanoyl) transferase LipB [Candidatus Zixiibacteriota bacterium]
MVATTDIQTFGWILDLGKEDYQRTLEYQHGLVSMRQSGMARDTIILVEHPPVVTVGRDGHPENYKDLPVEPFFVERGGDVTFHGPGQLVVYFIFNLTRRGRDLHKFLDNIQEGIIRALADYGVTAARGVENTGVWTDGKKLASIGVAVTHWISYHGTAINLNTTLADFKKINPCGLNADVMTSLQEVTSTQVDMKKFAERLMFHYSAVFETVFTPVDLKSLAEDIESQAGGYEI